MLTGREPFRGPSLSSILDRVKEADVRPPRQWDSRIPKELERICLKALAKEPGQRYLTAKDMSDDLLAAMTYRPQPIDVSSTEIPAELGELIEELEFCESLQ